VDAKFTQGVMTRLATSDPTTIANLMNTADPAAQQDAGIALGEEIVDAVIDEGLTTGIGGHVIGGARFKIPVIPIAAYANAKYYFGSPSDAFNPGAVFELGGGLAF